MGYKSLVLKDKAEGCPPGQFLFDTTIKGNSNAGHEYGTALSADERRILLQYLKMLGAR